MRIALTSDMHLHQWYGASGYGYQKPDQTVLDSLHQDRPDLWIDAGDYEGKKVFDRWPGVKFIIPGNHDYWGRAWDNWAAACHTLELPGLKVVGTTLWTDFNRNDPFAKLVVQHAIADYHSIREFSVEKCLVAHKAQLAWLLQHGKGADIIVSHHCPSMRSCHPRFRDPGTRRDLINFGFASELDHVVEELVPRFWFHGHTHDSHDYEIGKTRVVCHPCGYPHQNNFGPYLPRYFEVP